MLSVVLLLSTAGFRVFLSGSGRFCTMVVFFGSFPCFLSFWSRSAKKAKMLIMCFLEKFGTVPETDSTVPETDSTVPETDSTVPETDSTVPVTDSTVPETDSTILDNDSTVPKLDSFVSFFGCVGSG